METFQLIRANGSQPSVVGYEFSVENPKAVLCIIHGIGEHMGRYKRMAEYLNKSRIAVLGMDLIGHGISGGKRGHCAPRSMVLSNVTSLIEMAKEKYGNVPLTLYGHSMGGNIVLNYYFKGEKNNVPDKYIISAPWIRLVRNVSKSLYGVMKLISKIAPSATISSACDEDMLGNPDFVRPYKENPLVHDKISVQCALDGYSIGSRIESGEIYGEESSDRPMLLMHGTSDSICSVQGSVKTSLWLSKKINLEFIKWENYKHEIHNGIGDKTGIEVIDKIRDYILGE